MGKKSKKHTKPKGMTKELAMAMVDFNVGPWLIILGMREPAAAHELSAILTDYCVKESRHEKYEDNPDRMITDLSNGIHQLYGTYVGAKLKKYYQEGVPKQMIIAPPVGMPPMNGRNLTKF